MAEHEPRPTQRPGRQEPGEGAHRFEIGKDDLEAFSLCLVLGTLDAMRTGAWPMEAGIWTLGRPLFWKPLAEAGILKDVLEVLQQADELNAIEKLSGRAAAEEALDQMIAVVRSRLAELPNRSWYAFWAR